MDNLKLKEFQKKIEAVIRECGVTAAVFTGTHKDHYLGFVVGRMSPMTTFECALNTGRLF